MAKQRSMYGKDDLYVTDRSSPNATRVVDVQKWRTNQDDIRHLPGALPMQKLTIKDGAINPSAAFVAVDTEGGAPADYLTTITPGDLHDGIEIELVSADPSRTVTIKASASASGIQTMQNSEGVSEDVVLDPLWPIRLKLVSTENLIYWKEIPGARRVYYLAEDKLPLSGGTLTGSLVMMESINSFRNINLLSDDTNGLAIAFYNSSMETLLSSLRFRNNEVYVEKGRLGADAGIFSRGNINLRTDDDNGLALALYDLNGTSLYNSIRLKKDGTVVFELKPLAVSQGGTGARTVDAARSNLFVPSIPTNAEGPGLFLSIEIPSHTYVLQSGGTWAYSVYAVNASRNIIGTLGGIAAGGSSLYYAEASALFGWCWRVQ